MNFEWMILDHQSGLGTEIPASLARDEALTPVQIKTWLCPSDQCTMYNSRCAGGHPWPVWTNQRPVLMPDSCRRCCGSWPPGYTHCNAVCVRCRSSLTQLQASCHNFSSRTIETTFLKYGGDIFLFKIIRNQNAIIFCKRCMDRLEANTFRSEQRTYSRYQNPIVLLFLFKNYWQHHIERIIPAFSAWPSWKLQQRGGSY